jgi:hypothetical protein
MYFLVYLDIPFVYTVLQLMYYSTDKEHLNETHTTNVFDITLYV